MKTAILILALVAPTQEAGHSTVPTQGPAARERTEREADDPVLVQVERLRRDLADLGRRYRKAKGDERDALAQRAQPLLDDMALRLRDLTTPSPR
jgi:hypothetical protein